MIHSIQIKNYALISELYIEPGTGLNIITGETGAGKSIMLGALGLILGKRADTSVLLNKEQKCIVEVEFTDLLPQVSAVLLREELDDEDSCLLRREINASGKSRAFINDTPVTLDILKEIAPFLLDIHSQHETLLLKDGGFQLQLLDYFANNLDLRERYVNSFKQYQSLETALKKLRVSFEDANAESDYKGFLKEELDAIQLDPIVDKELENQLVVIQNAEELSEHWSQIQSLINEENYGVQQSLLHLKSALQKIADLDDSKSPLLEKLLNITEGIDEIEAEASDASLHMDLDPSEAQRIVERFDEITRLQQKHRVTSLEELVQIHDDLQGSFTNKEELEAEIQQTEKQLATALKDVEELAKKLSASRLQAVPKLQTNILETVHNLGMEDATFEIALDNSSPSLNGADEIEYLFSSNKGHAVAPLKQVASGGEFSRVMFAFKTAISKAGLQPTIIFDEIDAGISGKITHKMGTQLEILAKSQQMFAITHQPQIASKGSLHFKVEKALVADKTVSTINTLSKDERIQEIAVMLSGESTTELALQNARELLLG